MKVDVIKIILIVTPLIQELWRNRVPKRVTNLYEGVSNSSDKILDSLNDLAVKIVSEPDNKDLELHKQNLRTGISILENVLCGLRNRIETIKRTSGLY